MRALVLSLLWACSFEQGEARVDATSGSDGGDASTAEVVLAININGEAHTGSDFAGAWAADPGGICDGDKYSLSGIDVQNTVDDPLFTTWQYSFTRINCALGSSLPRGDYELTLVFGEVWIGPGCPYNGTQRVFGIELEGTLVEANVNTVTIAGCCHPDAIVKGAPFKRVFTQTVFDGTLDVTLRAAQGEQAMLSAVMLRRL